MIRFGTRKINIEFRQCHANHCWCCCCAHTIVRNEVLSKQIPWAAATISYSIWYFIYKSDILCAVCSFRKWRACQMIRKSARWKMHHVLSVINLSKRAKQRKFWRNLCGIDDKSLLDSQAERMNSMLDWLAWLAIKLNFLWLRHTCIYSYIIYNDNNLCT